MSDRDELARVLQDATKAPCPIRFWSAGDSAPTGYGELFAEAILASGYRKPRTITTPKELDALPFESVLRDAEGHVLERWGEPDKSMWVTVMAKGFIPRDDITLPATVLHEPEAAA